MSEGEQGQKGTIAERLSKLRAADMAPTPVPLDWLSLLPPLLAAGELGWLLTYLHTAKRQGRPRIWMAGAHVIKAGLNPVVVELMEQGWISHLALNGAAIVHDVELALWGHTSENVEDALTTGTFGQTEETNAWINRAIAVYGQKDRGRGLGQAIGQALLDSGAPYQGTSLFANAVGYRIPVTVHVGLGTDVFQTHPSADGAAIGRLSLADYQQFVTSLRRIEPGERPGAVLLNWGSAVLLPEVALKAYGQLRAEDLDLSSLVSGNFDMIQSYRGRTQIVERVKAMGGWGCAITGHHEIMLPLIAAQLLRLDGKTG